MDLQILDREIQQMGFEKNKNPVNRFVPDYIRGKDLLFLVGPKFYGRKVFRISEVYRDTDYNVLGTEIPGAPGAALGDWVTAAGLTMIRITPYAVARWNDEGTAIIYEKPQARLPF